MACSQFVLSHCDNLLFFVLLLPFFLFVDVYILRKSTISAINVLPFFSRGINNKCHVTMATCILSGVVPEPTCKVEEKEKDDECVQDPGGFDAHGWTVPFRNNE